MQLGCLYQILTPSVFLVLPQSPLPSTLALLQRHRSFGVWVLTSVLRNFFNHGFLKQNKRIQKKLAKKERKTKKRKSKTKLLRTYFLFLRLLLVSLVWSFVCIVLRNAKAGWNISKQHLETFTKDFNRPTCGASFYFFTFLAFHFLGSLPFCSTFLTDVLRRVDKASDLMRESWSGACCRALDCQATKVLEWDIRILAFRGPKKPQKTLKYKSKERRVLRLLCSSLESQRACMFGLIWSYRKCLGLELFCLLCCLRLS